jgi:drug/metabolite transporter (DMT)-like permease
MAHPEEQPEYDDGKTFDGTPSLHPGWWPHAVLPRPAHDATSDGGRPRGRDTLMSGGDRRVRVPLGATLALLSAALFGASTPLAKLLLDDTDPLMLAGLLYLGSGVGLAVFQGLRGVRRGGVATEAELEGRQWLWLGLAITSGGIAAPALLMYGLAGTSAAAAALLLNLEPIFTVLLAWIAFGEGIGTRVAVGMTAIAAGALVLTWPSSGAAGEMGAMAAIGMACLGWALDNNLTRKVALTDPVRIASLKGCVSGVVNVGAALAKGATLPSAPSVGMAAMVGVLGYGVSLVLFVRALREIGTARTGAYFSLSPFFGAALALVLFAGELSAQVVISGLCMGVGVWLHLTERHAHDHDHLELEHDHAHVHDEHHRHAHASHESSAEPHTHRHRHCPMAHRHPHFPDIHHHHRH